VPPWSGDGHSISQNGALRGCGHGDWLPLDESVYREKSLLCTPNSKA
jgi:hypothetical protein